MAERGRSRYTSYSRNGYNATSGRPNAPRGVLTSTLFSFTEEVDFSDGIQGTAGARTQRLWSRLGLIIYATALTSIARLRVACA